MTPPLDLREELRLEFRDAALPRVARMSALLESLVADPADREALGELSRHFHGLVGMGATCGYAEVSVLAESGEISTRASLRKRNGVRAADVQRWRLIVSRIHDELYESAPVAR